MSEVKTKKIFKQYNSTSDVVRCPNGRASVRKQLDLYAKAAVSLYGMISRDDFVDIFNKQNTDQTNSREVYILLLPLVLKEGCYAFYKEYIVHNWFCNDFEQADYLLRHQEGKPRYIPEREEFLRCAGTEYADNDHWWNVGCFMREVFGYSKNTAEGYREIREYMTYGDGIRGLGPILDRYNLIFDGEEQLQEFINLLMHAKNNTRIWKNNGYTPSELAEMIRKRDRNIVPFPRMHKAEAGRNDPCPCGSGKKYKNCCARFNDEKTAQLSVQECRLFYETWYGLMGFVNERKRVIKTKIKPEYPNPITDMEIHKVREELWKNPELIDQYIGETKLSQETIDILKLWRKKHKKGMLFVLEYQPEYAVAITSNEQGEDRLYGFKGISGSVATALQRNLPAQIETVLLPFKGKIIYDSFMSTMQIDFAEGAKAAFHSMYEKAIKHGIITSLE